MDADTYQRKAARTLIDEPDSTFTGNQLMLMWSALGLGGEAGEVLDHIKKGVCHQHGIDQDKLVKELGDTLWYVAALCSLIGVPMSDVMEHNIAKLEQRYPNGYSSDDSKARVDTHSRSVSSLIIDHLKSYGPMTLAELETCIGLSVYRISAETTRLYRGGLLKRQKISRDETRHLYYQYEAV